jgi:hypothetical protein
MGLAGPQAASPGPEHPALPPGKSPTDGQATLRSGGAKMRSFSQPWIDRLTAGSPSISTRRAAISSFSVISPIQTAVIVFNEPVTSHQFRCATESSGY